MECSVYTWFYSLRKLSLLYFFPCVQVNFFSVLIVYGKISNVMYVEKLPASLIDSCSVIFHSTTFLVEWACPYTSHRNTSQVNLLLAVDGSCREEPGRSSQGKNLDGSSLHRSSVLCDPDKIQEKHSQIFL